MQKNIFHGIMHHPNLQYALASEKPNIGNVRESFFINQLGVLGPLKYPSEGDFAFRDYVFEVGGRGKTNRSSILKTHLSWLMKLK